MKRQAWDTPWMLAGLTRGLDVFMRPNVERRNLRDITEESAHAAPAHAAPDQWRAPTSTVAHGCG